MIFHTDYTWIEMEGIMANYPKGKYAWTATVGEKGQIVIPKQARDLFDIKPGDSLLILGDDERGLAIPNKAALAELSRRVFADAEEEA